MISSMVIHGRGSVRGNRRRLPAYERGCGQNYRPTANFQPGNAEKLLDLCDSTGLSVAGFLDLLIERLDVDETTGHPVGWAEQPHHQEEIEGMPRAS